MLLNYTFTAEERAAALVKAKASQEAARKWADENLRQDFADANHWRELASAHGLRLPPRYIPGSSTKHLKRALKKLGVEVATYCRACGVSSLGALATMNPDWPAWAQVGMILEFKADGGAV